MKISNAFLVLGLIILAAAIPAAAQTSDSETLMINKRPLVDLGEDARKSIANGVDLNATFLVELTGQLDKNGRLERKTSRFTRTEGDKQLVELARKALESINDAGYFQYLSSSDVKNLKVIVSQDAQNSMFELSSEFDSESRAKMRRSSYDMLIKLASMQKKRKAVTDDEKDDLTLLESMSVASEGKKLVIRSVLPKLIVQDMIKRRISTK